MSKAVEELVDDEKDTTDMDIRVSWDNVDLLMFADFPTLRFFKENNFTYEQKIQYLKKQAEQRRLERQQLKEKLKKIGLDLNM